MYRSIGPAIGAFFPFFPPKPGFSGAASKSLLFTFNTGIYKQSAEVGTANQTVRDRGLPFLSFTDALIVTWAHWLNEAKA